MHSDYHLQATEKKQPVRSADIRIFQQFLIFKDLSKAKGLIRLDGSGVFESKFVDSKALYFRVESLCWNAQFHRGPVWT